MSVTEAVLRRVLQGISMRAYKNTLDYGKDKAISVSKSEAGRRFITGMKEEMRVFLNRRLEEDYVVIMIDGLEVAKWTVVAALGITSAGDKKVLGLIEIKRSDTIVWR